MNYSELMHAAALVRENAYAPYSGFKVGAALLGKSGKIYVGCNVENASFSATNCAERTAFFTAVAAGEHDFEAIAIVGGKDGVEMNECAPCGVCRQVMTEFCDKNFRIILGSPDKISVYTLGEIMPFTFSAKNLFEK